MNHQQPEPVEKLFASLKEAVSSDFVAYALQRRAGTDITWLYALGNRNDKYKRITVRYGKGIAGKVVSTGSPISVDAFPHGIHGKALDYPIMLAEQLVSAYAVPLFHTSCPKGVLLIGRRKVRPFTEDEKGTVNVFAKEVERLIM
ncbi:GAF domain-containing protein [Domibacillus sp. DTU_2020_1001157_1_SI_ALB_TIR_016]|uniref:GAF domain-containing protein n=1 Tax=Domibacillus sp. DTU_2020_1001157_1_SI_ALB_TIR_016 TaxID=3077789 RepID=UPI0028EDFAD9|nr:GAF domain-containing protein [Domibacillus sp. DTU_2020_1001157_1_SI_ALB_TIR_016]WNS78413.1 GAF domain-containing protein [Domibacillus sp. DTU_2020_1001157_1_SI_ALB_TIR_016]